MTATRVSRRKPLRGCLFVATIDRVTDIVERTRSCSRIELHLAVTAVAVRPAQMLLSTSITNGGWRLAADIV